MSMHGCYSCWYQMETWVTLITQLEKFWYNLLLLTDLQFQGALKWVMGNPKEWLILILFLQLPVDLSLKQWSARTHQFSILEVRVTIMLFYCLKNFNPIHFCHQLPLSHFRSTLLLDWKSTATSFISLQLLYPLAIPFSHKNPSIPPPGPQFLNSRCFNII